MRILASVILFTAPFEKIGWFLTTVFFFVSLVMFIQAYGIAKLAQSKPQQPQLRIEESDLSLDVNCLGDATLERTQKFVPYFDQDSIVEYDIYATGGISDVKFTIQERNDGQPKEVECETGLGTATNDHLVNRLKGGKKLLANHPYTRIMKLRAVGAYADTVSDAFSIVVSYPTEVIRGEIHFSGSCRIDESSVALNLVKESGLAVPAPKSLALDLNDGENLKFVIYNPSVGNRYRLVWHYRVRPTPTIRP